MGKSGKRAPSINKRLSEAGVCPWSQRGLDLRLTEEKMTVEKVNPLK